VLVLNDGNVPALLPSNPARIPILTIGASFELRTDAISSFLGILLEDILLPNDHIQDGALLYLFNETDSKKSQIWVS